jgi:hypothetical protein
VTHLKFHLTLFSPDFKRGKEMELKIPEGSQVEPHVCPSKSFLTVLAQSNLNSPFIHLRKCLKNQKFGARFFFSRTRVLPFFLSSLLTLLHVPSLLRFSHEHLTETPTVFSNTHLQNLQLEARAMPCAAGTLASCRPLVTQPFSKSRTSAFEHQQRERKLSHINKLLIIIHVCIRLEFMSLMSASLHCEEEQISFKLKRTCKIFFVCVDDKEKRKTGLSPTIRSAD